METPTTRGERVREAIAATGKKPAEVARSLHLTRGAVGQWLSGDTKNLKGENLLGLARLSGYEVQWILYGRGPKFSPNMDDTTFQELVETITDLTEEQQREVLEFAKFKRAS
ncbi:MAG: helix-turn-helix transcriptional regulator [Gammaproteobacteria bacterium]|nr:helix-turn-helix transcriptional regulator [Gammaproteobacteria bacterium]